MKNFRQILENVDSIDENLSRESKALAKEINDAARRESGADKKDFQNIAKMISQNKHKEAAKYMAKLDTVVLEDLVTFIMGHQEVFKKMYPKAREGQYVAHFARKVESKNEEAEPIVEAMSERDKKKRLIMIKKAVEKLNKQNLDKAKKDAIAMMKASGMFDEEEHHDDAELSEAKLKFYGSEISGLRDNKGGMYTAKPVEHKGKVGYRVVNQFGDFETIDLKAFAKKFG